jgi:hypothetical protein
MSLCYDFEKWTIISLAMVAITLTIGLVSLAYGQESNTTADECPDGYTMSKGVCMKQSNAEHCKNMVEELMKTGKFTEQEAKDMINSNFDELENGTLKPSFPCEFN